MPKPGDLTHLQPGGGEIGGAKAMEADGEEPDPTHEETDELQPRNLSSVFDEEAGWY